MTLTLDALYVLHSFAELSPPPDVARGVNFYEEVRSFEIALIKSALRASGGAQTRAAALLGLKLSTLNNMIKRYDINPSLT